MAASKAGLIEILGKEQGEKEYQYGLKVRAEIERTARAAANAVYGSGTAQAKQ